jgi:putative DNA primase/helicase
MDKDGSGYYCNQCGPGDTISLIQKTLGYSFTEAVHRIRELSGNIEINPTKEKNTDNRKILNGLWKKSTPLTGSDPVSKYLHKRGLVLSPMNVKFCKLCYESDTKSEMPAMIAKVVDYTGKPVTLHRTYLGERGKADIPSPKKTMPGVQKMDGCAVRLFKPKDGAIGIAEGIETAIAATQLFSIPTWSALNSVVLEKFRPPKGIKQVYIFGDNDANFTGQKATYTLANKLCNQDLIVHVDIPDISGNDWADVLAASGMLRSA